MRSNAIVRIVLYSLLILLLGGILVTGICADLLSFHFFDGSTEQFAGQPISLDPAEISRLSIDWAAGSITIRTADTDQITFYESGEISEKHTMVYSQKNGTLDIAFSRANVTVGIGSIPGKDLTITVPRDWVCQELEFDAASVDVTVEGLTVQELKLDGASAELSFNGSVDRMDIDGASVELDVLATNRPSQIDIDGASCEMKLYLPEECGFLVQMDGLSCSLDLYGQRVTKSGDYMSGDKHCKIYVDGMSCSVTINRAPTAAEVE